MSGEKTIEVRRRGTTIAKGDVLILYSSSPEMALIGSCKVADVNVCAVGHVKQSVNGHACLTKGELTEYLRNANRATLLTIRSVLPSPRPVTLESLRKLVPSFVVPQSYRFLNQSEATRLSKYVASER